MYSKIEYRKPVEGALTVLHLSLLSMNSLNQTQTAVFTLLLHILLPGDHITRIYLYSTCCRTCEFGIRTLHSDQTPFQSAFDRHFHFLNTVPSKCPERNKEMFVPFLKKMSIFNDIYKQYRRWRGWT